MRTNKRGAPTGKEFRYQSDFDTNGVIYYLGTDEGDLIPSSLLRVAVLIVLMEINREVEVGKPEHEP